ncbi:MAG: endonuclease [Chloroflexi bacterium]|nr:endonuclease [Chloroflexota bacterium]
MSYTRKDCVLVESGQAWADDNGRMNREPDDIGKNAIAYLDGRRRTHSLVFVVGKRRLYWVRNEDVHSFDPTQTGDQYDNKICLNCDLLKAVDGFSINQTRSDGTKVRRPRCIECFSVDSGKTMSARVRREYLEEHGPAEGDLWQCPICRKYSIAYVNVKIVVDHDQETGMPRGIICDSCNTGLGRFKNGENLLDDAMEYLRRREASTG